MEKINNRIPLQIIEGRLVLTAVIACSHLRIHKQILDFVIDTGSSESYLSDKDVRRLHIPIKGRRSIGEVDFGGSRFNRISLPEFDMYLLQEDKQKNESAQIKLSISALQTTKSSPKNIQVAQTLPSILGLDFLKHQKISLHVILSEDVAYLQCEC